MRKGLHDVLQRFQIYITFEGVGFFQLWAILTDNNGMKTAQKKRQFTFFLF